MLIHRICSVIAALILLSPATAQWFTREATHPLDDLPTVFSSLKSVEGTGGFDSKPIELTILCKPEKSESFRFGKTPMVTMVLEEVARLLRRPVPNRGS